ncbi:HTH-type transcriptional regulator HdfR [Enterobacteriaceae bacterium ESL0689]|nr:HTH-type transcriptional regulator HdfR [Enterobacteriaceae bacterium ESL0689]
MDTELLKTFLEVSRTRHFGQAAEALYLTQSAVSFRIRQLENQLGVNLFTRHRNNIRLTLAGDKLLPYAENLMNTWQMARKEVVNASLHNSFSIGSNASLWECILGQWLGTLYQKNDNMQFEARIAQRQSLIKQLRERQLDLLITTESAKIDQLSSQLLGNLTLALYCTSPYKNKNELNYLRLEWGMDFQQNETDLLNPDDLPLLTTDSARLAYQQLAMLNGCAWLPVSWAEKKADLYRVKESTVVSRPLYAIWLQNSDKQGQIHEILKTDMSG